MKKYFIFASLALFLFAAKAEAKLISFQAGEDSVQIDSQLTVKIEEVDRASKNWVLDWDQELGILKFYPSNKSIRYQIINSATQVVNYKILGANQDNWQTANSVTDHKIVLQLEENNQTSEIIEELVVKPPVINDNLKFSQVFSSEDQMVQVSANQNLVISKVMAPINNGNLERVSKFYQVPQTDNFNLKFFYQEDDFRSKNIYYYDFSNSQWLVLPSYNDVEEKYLTAKIRDNQKDLVIAIFADPNAQDGIASFYDQSRYRYFNYKNGNFAASRDYPKGTKLKVTRLKTGESIVIEVNDYGPELQTGRVIDLDTEAFKQLSSLGAGLIYVKVEVYDQNK